MTPLVRQSLLLLAVFAAATGIASAAGAINLGTAMTFGQVAFAVVLVALMLLPGRDDRASAEAEPGTAPPAE